MRQEKHVSEIIKSWPKTLKNSDKEALNPASKTLFEKGEGLLLSAEKKEVFHSTVAKGLFVGCRSRPNICPTISVLSSRVREPNMDDWVKCDRLVHYLRSTSNLHLVLRYDGLSIPRWHVDAAYAVHPDFRSHSGGVCFLSEKGGGMASRSMKQKLNFRSSTEAKKVGVDDFLSKIL